MCNTCKMSEIGGNGAHEYQPLPILHSFDPVQTQLLDSQNNYYNKYQRESRSGLPESLD